MTDVRYTLDHLIQSRGEDYRSISRLLGRNAAYIQQFIHRGVPRKLDEDDRRKLATYFDVDESVLGGPFRTKSIDSMRLRAGPRHDLVVVPRLAIDASAGPGGLGEDESIAGAMAFDPQWLRTLKVQPQYLSMIRVLGDSMQPTLNAGDDIMVDRADAHKRLRDGIYVLRADGALVVKRLAVNPATRSFIVQSDNKAYPDWRDIDLAQIDIIGRVIWVGRQVG